jgi:type I restriction enzyme S subunit
LLNITGDGTTFARACLVPEDVRPACVNQHVAIVRADPDKADPGYLLAYLTHPAVKRYIESFRLPRPPINEQRTIAATLGGLDAKIDSNHRLIGLIPQLIHAYIDHELAVGPHEVAIAELAAFINGGAYTKGASGTGRLVIRIAELNSGPGRSTVHSDIDVPDDKTARPGDILMSWSGSLDVYRWFRDEAIINQHIFKVIPANGYPAWLVFDRLEAVMPVFQGIAKDKATTMGHIQRGHLGSTTVAVPAAEAVDSLIQVVEPLWKRLLLAERENMRLARLRDALLPELLSGRFRVPEAAEVIEGTA